MPQLKNVDASLVIGHTHNGEFSSPPGEDSPNQDDGEAEESGEDM
jgi:hypothetical protein